MQEFQPIPYNDKLKFYSEVRAELRALFVPFWLSNLANVSAVLMSQLPDINWAGFYLFDGEELKLGPFQGLPACLTIALNRGVCGLAGSTRSSVLVDDVHAFPGHIACDARSRSELVIPLVADGELLGVLDVDSPSLARFDRQDQAGLEGVVSDLLAARAWPKKLP
jgi:L-methionine (R)-S-oxide reductase